MATIPTISWDDFQQLEPGQNISSAEYNQRRYSEQFVAAAKRETRFTGGQVQQQQVMYNPPIEVQGTMLLNNEELRRFQKWFKEDCKLGTERFIFKHYSLDAIVDDVRDEHNKVELKQYVAQFIGFPQTSAHGATWTIRVNLRLYDIIEGGY